MYSSDTEIGNNDGHTAGGEENEEGLILYEASGVRYPAHWQCIRYIAPSAAPKKWKASDAKGVYCTECKIRIRYNSVQNPKAVQRHMTRFHQDLLDNYREPPHSPKKRIRSNSTLKRHKPCSEESEGTQEDFNRLLARWSALSLRSPEAILGDQHLSELIALANSSSESLSLPSSLQETMLLEYHLLKGKVLRRIQEDCNFFSFSTHLLNRGFLMTLTLHFLTENFSLRSFVLEVKHVAHKRVGDVIQREIITALHEWSLSESLLSMMVRDHDRNLISALDEWGVQHFPCVVHTLNLVFGPFLLNEVQSHWNAEDKRGRSYGRFGELQKMVADMTLLWHFIRDSSHEKHESLRRDLHIDNYTSLDPSTLTLEVLTCLAQSSTEVNDFLAYFNSDEVTEIFETVSISPKKVSDRTWAFIKGILYLLSPFGKATAALNDPLYSTYVSTLPVLRRVKDFISDPYLFNFQKRHLTKTKGKYLEIFGSFSFFPELIRKLEAYQRLLVEKFEGIFPHVESPIIWTTLLDPRLGWKSGHWKNEQEKESSKCILLQEIEKLALPEFQLPIQESSSFTVKPESDDDDFDLDFNKTTVESCSLSELFDFEKSKLKASILQEVDTYLLETSNESPLKWWQEHCFKYPNVARVARKWLAVTANSNCCSSRDLHELCLKSNVQDESIKAQIFLYNNYDESLKCRR